MGKIVLKHLVPVRTKFTGKRYNDITQEDCHPTIDEIRCAYSELILSKSFDFLCGDVLNISSVECDYNLYYFIARDGLEKIPINVE